MGGEPPPPPPEWPRTGAFRIGAECASARTAAADGLCPTPENGYWYPPHRFSLSFNLRFTHPNTHMYVPGNSVCQPAPTRPLGPRSNNNKQGEGMAEWGRQQQVPAYW